VADDLPLRRLFALTTLCHSLVSLDTGPAHVAAVLGCPTLVIAGIVDPRWYRPIGEHVAVVTAIPPERWPASSSEFGKVHHMTDIGVPQVAAAWDRLVRGASA
jgi:heptosyltransferase-2/heptosyltransferase-3